LFPQKRRNYGLLQIKKNQLQKSVLTVYFIFLPLQRIIKQINMKRKLIGLMTAVWISFCFVTACSEENSKPIIDGTEPTEDVTEVPTGEVEEPTEGSEEPTEGSEEPTGENEEPAEGSEEFTDEDWAEIICIQCDTSRMPGRKINPDYKILKVLTDEPAFIVKECTELTYYGEDGFAVSSFRVDTLHLRLVNTHSEFYLHGLFPCGEIPEQYRKENLPVYISGNVVTPSVIGCYEPNMMMSSYHVIELKAIKIKKQQTLKTN
jgi:hypothetical protein